MNTRMHRHARLFVAACIAAATSLIAAAEQPASVPGSAATESAKADIRAAAVRHGGTATDPDHAGIWKVATPPRGSMHGEFANNDPLGLAAGKKIKADCSLNWVDPDSGKRYCFSSATSLVVFQDEPHSYLRRASKYWSGNSR